MSSDSDSSLDSDDRRKLKSYKRILNYQKEWHRNNRKRIKKELEEHEECHDIIASLVLELEYYKEKYQPFESYEPTDNNEHTDEIGSFGNNYNNDSNDSYDAFNLNNDDSHTFHTTGTHLTNDSFESNGENGATGTIGATGNNVIIEQTQQTDANEPTDINENNSETSSIISSHSTGHSNVGRSTNIHNEKITCSLCNSRVVRKNLARHLKSRKCHRLRKE